MSPVALVLALFVCLATAADFSEFDIPKGPYVIGRAVIIRWLTQATVRIAQINVVQQGGDFQTDTAADLTVDTFSQRFTWVVNVPPGGYFFRQDDLASQPFRVIAGPEGRNPGNITTGDSTPTDTRNGTTTPTTVTSSSSPSSLDDSRSISKGALYGLIAGVALSGIIAVSSLVLVGCVICRGKAEDVVLRDKDERMSRDGVMAANGSASEHWGRFISANGMPVPTRENAV